MSVCRAMQSARQKTVIKKDDIKELLQAILITRKSSMRQNLWHQLIHDNHPTGSSSQQTHHIVVNDTKLCSSHSLPKSEPLSHAPQLPSYSPRNASYRQKRTIVPSVIRDEMAQKLVSRETPLQTEPGLFMHALPQEKSSSNKLSLEVIRVMWRFNLFPLHSILISLGYGHEQFIALTE